MSTDYLGNYSYYDEQKSKQQEIEGIYDKE